MKSNYLFPNRFRKLGWILFIPLSILGIYTLFWDVAPSMLDFNVPSVFIDNMFGDDKFFGKQNNNLLDEIIGVLLIISLLFIAFSKEKIEDEFISKIRLESLVWAVYVNYIILIFSFVMFYDFAFMYVMIFNMYTILLFFIIRYYWQIGGMKKIMADEE